MRERVLLTGGRDLEDYSLVRIELRKLPRNSILIEGGATGADSLVRHIAHELNRKEGYNFWIVDCPADWRTHDRAAGPIRNREMLDEFGPTLGVAFPGGSGTKDMVDEMRRRGLPVIEVSADG